MIFVTTDEAAEIAGVSAATIRQWVVRGHLEPLMRGAKPLRFRYDDVARTQAQMRPKSWHLRHAEARNAWVAGKCRDDLSQ